MIVPRTDRCLGEIEVLLGGFLVDILQLGGVSTIVMVSGTVNVLRGIGIGVYLERILLLVGLAVVVVVVVEANDFGLQTGSTESGSEGGLDEITLLLPRHIEGHRVAPVERLVLHRHAGGADALCLKSLYPFNEIGGVVLIVVGVEVTAHPTCVRTFLVDVVHLHPARATPRRTHHFEVGIDSQYLLEHRDDVVFLVRLESKVLYALGVATSIVVVAAGVEVAASDRYAHVTVAHTVLHTECLAEQFGAVGLRHLHEVVRCGSRDGSPEAVEVLIAHVGIDGERYLGGHIHALGKVFADSIEVHGVVGGGDVGHHITFGILVATVVTATRVGWGDGGIACREEGCGKKYQWF